MITTWRKEGTRYRAVTQRYKIGVAIYIGDNPIPDQCRIEVPEKQFHRDLRENLLDDKIQYCEKESTPLPVLAGV